jgi:tetratricopeptide (TPR) repeat protein
MQMKLIDNLYENREYDEVIKKCAENISLIDDEDRSNFLLLYEFYSRLFNAYFRLSNKAQCHSALDMCMIYAETDLNSQITEFNRMRLFIVTGEKLDEAEKIIETLLEYWTDTNDKKRYAKTLNWKGELFKDYRYFKQALKIFEELGEDLGYDKEVAITGMKKYRHLN